MHKTIDNKEKIVLKRIYLLLTVLLISIPGMIPNGGSTAIAADDENCLMCHKYPSLARIGKDGLVKNFQVSEHIFMNSLHGKVACRSCHTYIKKFPHDPVTEKVNCANICHIKPPFSDENFSHKKIIDVFDGSVHAVRPDDSPLKKQSNPDCKYCHLNPLYKRAEENIASYNKTLARCLNCHQQKGVADAYHHITHRLRHKTTRSSQEIVKLCAGCHADTALMEKLGLSGVALEAVRTYKESIHGKMTTLGSEKAADCISCHASSLIHDIYKKDNPQSTINAKNIQDTCRNCHTKINKYFVKIAVHPSINEPHDPILFILSNLVLRFILYGTIFGLMGLLFHRNFPQKERRRLHETEGRQHLAQKEETIMNQHGQRSRYDRFHN